MPVPFVSRLLVLLVFIAAASSVHAQSHIWTSLDQPPGVSDAIDLELAPWGDLYLLTYSGIYCSTDDGVSWKDCSFQYPSSFLVYDIAIDSSGNILAGGHGGSGSSKLYRSADRGGSWAPVSSYTLSSASAIAVGLQGEYFVGGPSPATLQRSTDQGTTWTKLRPGAIMTRSMNVMESGTILARGGGTFNGLWRSTNGGDTWDSLVVIHHGFRWLLSNFREVSRDTVLAIGETGSGSNGLLFRSIDGGRTWLEVKIVSEETVVNGLLVRNNGSILVSVLDKGLFMSTSEGSKWSNLQSTGIPHSFTAFVETLEGGIVAAGPTGPYRSTDGAIWQLSSGDIHASQLRELISSQSGSLLAISSDQGGVVTSDNGGESWSLPLLDGGGRYIRWLAAMYDGRAIVLTNNVTTGAYIQSTEREFQRINFPNFTLPNAITTVVHDNVEYILAARLNAPSYISADTGKSWQIIDSLPVRNLSNLTNVATAANGVVYVATTDGLYKTQAPEFTFKEVINGPTTNGAFGLDATEEGMVLVVEPDMIWRSTDNGISWQEFGRADEGDFQAYTITPDGTMVVSTTKRNIYMRRVADTEWRTISGELAGTAIRQLLLHNGSFYALTTSLQLYRSEAIPASIVNAYSSSSLSASIVPSTVSDAATATLRLSVRTLDEYRIDVYDAHGEVVLSIPSLTLLTGDHQIPLDLSQLHSGRYWCSVWSDAAMTLCTLQVIR